MKSLMEKMYSSLWLFCHGFRLKKAPSGIKRFSKKIGTVVWYRTPSYYSIRDHKFLVLQRKERGSK